jgi:hypothetical protein
MAIGGNNYCNYAQDEKIPKKCEKHLLQTFIIVKNQLCKTLFKLSICSLDTHFFEQHLSFNNISYTNIYVGSKLISSKKNSIFNHCVCVQIKVV